MYRYCFTARQFLGVPVHLRSRNRVSVTPAITSSRRVLTPVLLAAVIVAAEVTFLTAAGPASAVAIDHPQAKVVSPMAVGHGHELTTRQVLLGCRPWHPYR